jgi:phospholipid transport system substrate-binding protein
MWPRGWARKVVPVLAVVAVEGFASALPTAAAPASAPIEQLDAGLIRVMKAGRTAPFRQRYDVLVPLVTGAIDLDFILQSAIGASWPSLPPDQQATLKTAFQRYSVATYVANFDSFAGERFDLQPSGDGAVVTVRIVPGSGGGETHVLRYAMRQTASGWKAGDVMADGTISQVVAQQSEIRSLFTRGGYAGLLARLQQKTAELSGGAVQ